jgi:AcrR family transcriptional regulator
MTRVTILKKDSKGLVGTPPSRRERSKRERRKRIKEAALALFMEKGFEASLVEEITERADVAKGTFFNYFPSKRAVLVDSYEALDARFFAAIRRLDPTRPAPSLARYFRWAERTLRAEGTLARVLFEAIASQAALDAIDRESGRRVEREMAHFLAEARARGTLWRGADPDLGAAILTDLWAASVRGWFEANQVGSLAKTLTAKVGLFFQGLASTRPDRRHGG